MMFGVWNFGTMPFGSSPAENLIGIYAATQLTGVMHDQPAQMFAGPGNQPGQMNQPFQGNQPGQLNQPFQGTQPGQMNQPFQVNQGNHCNLPYSQATQPPPPFGCGKSAMLQLWEIALQNNPQNNQQNNQ